MKNRSDKISFTDIACRIRQCRLCHDSPVYPPPLSVDPNPLFQGSETARLCIAGQAPGLQAHNKGRTFDDPSGNRLREWLGLNWDSFYNPADIAIIPMGFCFPGYDARGTDLPPRRECALLWRKKVFEALPKLELILCIGQYSQNWHMQKSVRNNQINLTERVRNWRIYLESKEYPRIIPLPHPSWRNNTWLKKNPWFEEEMLPVLRQLIRQIIFRGN